MKRFNKALWVIAMAVFSTGLLAAGDPVRGKARYESLCVACHSIDYNGTGPAHRGVFGRKAGARSDYTYSPALSAANFVWNEQSLGRWLSNPEKLVPGQKMWFSVPSAKDRSDIIAYLKTQSAD